MKKKRRSRSDFKHRICFAFFSYVINSGKLARLKFGQRKTCKSTWITGCNEFPDQTTWLPLWTPSDPGYHTQKSDFSLSEIIETCLFIFLAWNTFLGGTFLDSIISRILNFLRKLWDESAKRHTSGISSQAMGGRVTKRWIDKVGGHASVKKGGRSRNKEEPQLVTQSGHKKREKRKKEWTKM